MSEPTIKLSYAEMLHVTLSTVAHIIGSQTSYPTANLECVLNAYRTSRNEHMAAQGLTVAEINAYTEAAAEAIVGWLDGKTANSDFDQWAKEMFDESDNS